MNFSQFFIQRPIFAAVLSLIILIGGAISLFQLPISEYPEVVPPTVVVRANFPGANPKVIGETVAAAPRAGDQRRREHALHVVAERRPTAR
jgi:multidrug efflux pump